MHRFYWSPDPVGGTVAPAHSRSSEPHFPRLTFPSRPQEVVLKHQAALTKSLVGLVTPPSPSTTPTVKPGRPARALIARILVALLRRGDTKNLFDLAQSLLRALNGNELKGAPEREKEWRIAAAYILGEVYSVHGQQVMSLYIEIVMATTRVFRTSSYPVILRHAALVCLRKVLHVVARSMSDQTTRDTLKALRTGLADKAGAVVRGCADVRAPALDRRARDAQTDLVPTPPGSASSRSRPPRAPTPRSPTSTRS